jgi:branched-chain amino acid transport system substrate-binding protein
VYPMYFGTTKKVPQYDFVIATDIMTLTGNEVMPSCDEIKKERKK